ASSTTIQLNSDLDGLVALADRTVASHPFAANLYAAEKNAEGQVKTELASLESSGVGARDLLAYRQLVHGLLVTVDRRSELASAGRAADATKLAGLQDRTGTTLAPVSVLLAKELRQGADRASGQVKVGVIALAAALATGVGFLMWWESRRERRANSDTGEKRSQARFEAIVEHGSVLVVLTDVAGAPSYVSPSLTPLLGHSSNSWNWAGEGCVHPDDLSVMGRLLDVAVRAGKAGPEDFRLHHADGSWRTMEVTLADLSAVPDVGGVVWNCRDVTEQRSTEVDLARAALADPLTGLANRDLFRDRLALALARANRTGRPVAVLWADLDGFKAINDTYGHSAGDQVIVEVAARLLGSVRSGDTVARVGGDEFTVLLEGAPDLAVVEDLARRTIDVLRQPMAVQGSSLRVGVSVGIAFAPTGAESADELLRNADAAMYTAKSEGRGRFATFEPAMHARAQEQVRLSVGLTGAIERSEFVLYYQPTLALASHEIEGTEALIRWRHPTRGLILPGQFIPVAEGSGQILRIGRWVLEQACEQQVRWQRDFPASPARMMNVNVSGRQLLDESLVPDVKAILAATGVDPPSVVLEMTESVIMDDVEAMTLKLRKLKDLGVELAIDDFGTGYSSLAYLQQFPMDILKIDRMFVQAAGSGSHDGEALLRAIVDLGTTLRLKTVAEGIEQAVQADHMLTLGCLSGQGYFFARPMSAEEFGDILAVPQSRLAVPGTWMAARS
ncbi:MAG TPA: EAL domain-containing protein, partial [Acidimicrobiales bacterium]|nr:EAL domain-containing protein [Acidimicrobiales bacterium]